MQVRGVCFAVVICLLAAVSGGSGQENDVTLNKVPEPNAINTELNTEVLPEKRLKNITESKLPDIDKVETSTLKSNGDNATTEAANTSGGTEGVKPDSASGEGKKTPTLDAIAVKVLRAEENRVGFSDMISNKQIIFKNVTHMKSYSVDYHFERRLLFYVANNIIFREEVVGSLKSYGMASPVVIHGVDGPISIAVDWVHDKLYWLSNRYNCVECSTLDGTNRTLLVDSFQNTLYPNNIAVDPYEGYIFVVSNHSIYKATLAGKGLTKIQLHGTEARQVRCLTVDTHKKRLYYTGKVGGYNTGQPYLASCDYEGQHVQDIPLAINLWNDIFSLSVFRDTLYFAHYPRSGADSLCSLDLTQTPPTAASRYLSDDREGGIWSIKAYHPEVQKKDVD